MQLIISYYKIQGISEKGFSLSLCMRDFKKSNGNREYWYIKAANVHLYLFRNIRVSSLSRTVPREWQADSSQSIFVE